MSVPSVSGLPAVPRSALPADVREAPAAEQQQYRAALGFERMLVERLAEGMTATAGGDDEATAATRAYRDMLPGTLADSVTAAGGVGLGAQLFHAMRGSGA